MEEQLKQYLQEFVETLKQGGQFAQEQLPLFVKEYLAWGFWESVALAVLFIIFTTGLILSAKKIYTKMIENEPFDEFGYYMGIAICTLASIATVLGFVVNTLRAIKVAVAPRVYLIENLMNLIN